MYRTIDGKVYGPTRINLLEHDKRYVDAHCIVIENGKYRLYEIKSMEYLIPLLYGRYKINVTKFPIYLLLDKQTDLYKVLPNKSLSECIKQITKAQ